jgi:hypothetical protein
MSRKNWFTRMQESAQARRERRESDLAEQAMAVDAVLTEYESAHEAAYGYKVTCEYRKGRVYASGRHIGTLTAAADAAAEMRLRADCEEHERMLDGEPDIP